MDGDQERTRAATAKKRQDKENKKTMQTFKDLRQQLLSQFAQTAALEEKLEELKRQKDEQGEQKARLAEIEKLLHQTKEEKAALSNALTKSNEREKELIQKISELEAELQARSAEKRSQLEAEEQRQRSEQEWETERSSYAARLQELTGQLTQGNEELNRHRDREKMALKRAQTAEETLSKKSAEWKEQGKENIRTIEEKDAQLNARLKELEEKAHELETSRREWTQGKALLCALPTLPKLIIELPCLGQPDQS